MVAVLQPATQGRIIPIDRAVVLVGRSADCDAVVTGSQKISRRHCCLVQVDDEYYVRDLGSMNGVWLNGEKVDREAKMSAGDNLSIGDIEFRFHPNARVEQKPTVGGPASPLPVVVMDDEEDQTERSGPPKVSIPIEADNLIEVMDDVIPLDQVELLDGDDDLDDDDGLPQTNELKAINQPIIDDDPDDIDEIIVFDD